MHELLQKLLDQRVRAVGGAREVYERMSADDYQSTAEDQQELDRRNAELDDLDERIDQLNARIKRETGAAEVRAEAEQYIRPERERERSTEPTLEDRLTQWVRSEDGPKSFEIPVSGIQVVRSAGEARGWAVRDLTKATAAAGAATVPVSFRQSLYEHLIENSGIRQTRAEIITTASGEELILPKTLTHPASGTLTAEAGLIVDNDPTFGQGTLNAYKYTSLVQLSSELLQDTGVDLLGYLARAFGQALGNGSGAAFITGDGSAKPQGVVTAGSAMVNAGTSTGVPTADKLIDLFYAVKEPYAMNGEWLMRRATVGVVRKLKDSNGQYLWQPSLVVGAPETILGHPVRTDPNMPAVGVDGTAIAFGDFSTYKIRDVGNVRFERSDDFAFANDLVTYRAILRTDGDLLDRTGSIGLFTGGTAA